VLDRLPRLAALHHQFQALLGDGRNRVRVIELRPGVKVDAGDIQVLPAQTEHPTDVLWRLGLVFDRKDDQNQRRVGPDESECDIFPSPRVVPPRLRPTDEFVTLGVAVERPIRDVDSHLGAVGEVVVPGGGLEQFFVRLMEHLQDGLPGGLPKVVREVLPRRNVAVVVERLVLEVLRGVVDEAVSVGGGDEHPEQRVLRHLGTAVALQSEVLERLQAELPSDHLDRREPLAVSGYRVRCWASKPVFELRALQAPDQRFSLARVVVPRLVIHPSRHPVQSRLTHRVLDAQRLPNVRVVDGTGYA